MDDKIVIDFSVAGNGSLNESFLRMFGASVQAILKAMFGGSSIPMSIRGSPQQVEQFAQTLSHEKRYWDAYQKFGLDSPMTYKSKFRLNSAIRDFERVTGLVWPLH